MNPRQNKVPVFLQTHHSQMGPSQIWTATRCPFFSPRLWLRDNVIGWIYAQLLGKITQPHSTPSTSTINPSWPSGNFTTALIAVWSTFVSTFCTCNLRLANWRPHTQALLFTLRLSLCNFPAGDDINQGDDGGHGRLLVYVVHRTTCCTDAISLSLFLSTWREKRLGLFPDLTCTSEFNEHICSCSTQEQLRGFHIWRLQSYGILWPLPPPSLSVKYFLFVRRLLYFLTPRPLRTSDVIYGSPLMEGMPFKKLVRNF